MTKVNPFSFSESALRAEPDPEMTLELFDLIQTPEQDRDEDWLNDFFEIAPTAALRGFDQQIQKGPDGFPYLMLSLPKSGEDFDAFSIEHSIDHCLKVGCGIALFKDPDNLKHPEWVFSFGSLWSYAHFGNFVIDPADEIKHPDHHDQLDSQDQTEPAIAIATESVTESVTASTAATSSTSTSTSVSESAAAPTVSPITRPTDDPDRSAKSATPDREVFIGYPSEEYLPQLARRAIKRFLKETIGLEKPRVALIIDPELKPSRSLMFADLHPDRFEKKEHFMFIMNSLRWFLPPSRGIMVAIPELDPHASPL